MCSQVLTTTASNSFGCVEDAAEVDLPARLRVPCGRPVEGVLVDVADATMFSSGCGAAGRAAPPPARAAPAAAVSPRPSRPGVRVSSSMRSVARPPEAMNAMSSLPLRFLPRRSAGAPAMSPAVPSAPPTNSRRVIRGGCAFFPFVVFMAVFPGAHSRRAARGTARTIGTDADLSAPFLREEEGVAAPWMELPPSARQVRGRDAEPVVLSLDVDDRLARDVSVRVLGERPAWLVRRRYPRRLSARRSARDRARHVRSARRRSAAPQARSGARRRRRSGRRGARSRRPSRSGRVTAARTPRGA